MGVESMSGLRSLLEGNGLEGYIENFERYGFDEESITAVELRDYDVLGIAGDDRQKLFKLIQRLRNGAENGEGAGDALSNPTALPAEDLPPPGYAAPSEPSSIHVPERKPRV